MKKALLFGLMLSGLSSWAQQTAEPCGTSAAEKQRTDANPALLIRKEEWLQKINTLQLNNGTPKAVYRVPVVFHIMHQYGSENISRAQIDDCLRVLNEDFNRQNADTNDTRAMFKPLAAAFNIEFIRASIDPEGNCTDGITRTYSPVTFGANDMVKYDAAGGKNAWPTDRYMNIWVVGSIKLDGTPQGGIILGYAYYPYAAGEDYYGIVMHNQYTGTIGTSSDDGRTISHEAGHYFGLAHTFDDGCGNNCNNSGDNVCDTPPSVNATYGCSSTQNTCTNDNVGAGAFPSDTQDMVENFMSYDNCQNLFTQGQKSRVNASLGSDLALMVSVANAAASGIDQSPQVLCTPLADFYALERAVCAGDSIRFLDNSTQAVPGSQSWLVQSADTSFTVNASDPWITFPLPGVYSVTYTASNVQGSAQRSRNSYITVFEPTAAGAAYYVDDMDQQPITTGRWGVFTKGPDTFNGWEETTAAGVSNGSCVYVSNNEAQFPGYRCEIISGAYYVQGMDQPVVRFKTAFARRDADSKDLLRLYGSNNCGNTWTLLSVKPAAELTSAPDQTTNFVPTAAQWVEHEVQLTGTLANTQNLRLKFEFQGKGGNNIYLDDINVLARFSNEESAAGTLNIFPNPAADNVRIESTQVLQEVELLSAEGKLISVYETNSSQLNLNISDVCKPGIYYLRIHSGTQTLVRKIVKM